MGDGSPIHAAMPTDITNLIRRARRVATKTGRTPGGVSKALFDDVRTLDLLADGWRGIQVDRLARGEDRLEALEAIAFPQRTKAKAS